MDKAQKHSNSEEYYPSCSKSFVSHDPIDVSMEWQDVCTNGRVEIVLSLERGMLNNVIPDIKSI
jgi:hypothetical protein